MKRLIVEGDAGFRKDARIEVGGEEYTCFQVNRNGDYHGPDEVQLWCVVGEDSERGAFDRREFVPHFLDVERVDAGAVEVLKRGGDRTI